MTEPQRRPYTSEVFLSKTVGETTESLRAWREDLGAYRAQLQAHARQGTFFNPTCQEQAAYLGVELSRLADELYNLALDWQTLNRGVTN